MTSTNTFENDPFLEKFGKDVFRSDVKAARPATATVIAGFTIASCAAAVLATVIAMNPMGVTESSASPSTQGAISSKSDMLSEDTSLQACEGQAWGAFSGDCAAALTGQSSVRSVQYHTVETPATAENTTVLARMPANS